MKSRFIKIIIIKIFAITLFLFSHNCVSQNLVPNGDFENFTFLPDNHGQLDRCVGWSNVNGNYTGSTASPDYFHTSGTGSASLPQSFFGTVNPHSGNAVAGILTIHHTSPDNREYISIQLTSPMVIGQTYNVSFWLTNGISDFYGGYSSNRIGMQFSENPLIQIDREPIGGIPQIEIQGEVWTNIWDQYSFNFTSDSEYNFITIGNFYNDILTSSSFQSASLVSAAYYFIDKIEITPATGINVVNHQSFFIYPNPATDKIHISTSLHELGLAEIFDLTGKKVKEKFIATKIDEINITDLENGFYILRIGEKQFKIVKQ